MLMNMSMTDLETGLAWAVELLSSRALDEKRVPPKLVEFADRVSIDDAIMARVRQANQRFIRYPNITGIKAVRQAITWEFDISKTDYTLAVSKFNDTIHDPAQPSQPSQTPRLSKDSWSLSLGAVAWDTCFAENESLAIGERVDWDDDFAKWFDKDMGTPKNDDDDEEEPDGFAQLLDKLNEIERLLLRKDGNDVNTFDKNGGGGDSSCGARPKM
jgi:hypothetical protein